MRKVKFVKNNFYHIYNRGVEKRSIFQDDNDRWRFLQGLFLFNDEKNSFNLLWHLEQKKRKATFGLLKDILKEQGDKRSNLVNIIADCLMPNHFHLILEEIRENGITLFMHKLGTGYTKYFNKRYQRVGSLFQGTFKAVLIDKEDYLRYLLVYINVVNPGELIEPFLKENGIKNPEQIIKFAGEYPWSTNQEHLGKRDSIILGKNALNKIFGNSDDYKNFVQEVLVDERIKSINHLFLES